MANDSGIVFFLSEMTEQSIAQQRARDAGRRTPREVSEERVAGFGQIHPRE